MTLFYSILLPRNMTPVWCVVWMHGWLGSEIIVKTVKLNIHFINFYSFSFAWNVYTICGAVEVQRGRGLQALLEIEI